MLDAVRWEVVGRDGEAVERAGAPPVFYAQPFVPWRGSACCLKHSHHIQVNGTSSSEVHFGVFFRYCWPSFVQVADHLSCEISTSNLGRERKV